MPDRNSTGGRWSSTVESSCTICRTSHSRPAYVVDGHHIVRCTSCKHLYVSPRPFMEEVVEIYSEDYFENPAFQATDHDAYFGYADYLRDRRNIQLRLAQVLEQIERHEWKGSLLDIGCGMGLFVEVAAAAGWDAWGIDLNGHAVKWAQENISDHVQCATVRDVDFADGSFDCITMFDVIEHLADPREELSDVWRLLRPGGLLVLVTPDAGALVSRALGAGWLEMKRAPEHLQFFTVRGMAQLLALSGFTAYEWHSIGKISTVRNMLADLRFYSEPIFSRVEQALDRFGVADRVIDIDPHTKMCIYARKTGMPIEDDRSLPSVSVRRSHPGSLGRFGVRSIEAVAEPPVEGRSGDPDEFRARQQRYWERKERFLDPRDPGPTAFAVPKLDWAAQHLHIDETTSVLDVGAGNGTVTWHLNERAGLVVGIDFSRNLLARSPCENPMLEGDAAQLPFRDGQFDVVVESNFLHHVSDPVAVLSEMRRVCRDRLLLIEPNRWHLPMSAFMAATRSEWRGLQFDMRFLRNLVGEAGLRLVAAEPQGAIYPNMTPRSLLSALARFDRPGPLGAYIVAVCEPIDA
ncbi:MAG: methyltransferase domain-containing protein [Acidimicrobiales bacterium]